MTIRPRKPGVLAALLLVVVVLTSPAHAFRCGNKIVVRDMHEVQVRRACGAPTTMRQLGRAIRGVNVPYERRLLPGLTERTWVLRTWFDRSAAPAWYSAHRDPLVGSLISFKS